MHVACTVDEGTAGWRDKSKLSGSPERCWMASDEPFVAAVSAGRISSLTF